MPELRGRRAGFAHERRHGGHLGRYKRLRSERSPPEYRSSLTSLSLSLIPVLCTVLSDTPQVFPADLGDVGRPAKKVSTVQVVEMEADNELDELTAQVADEATKKQQKPPTRRTGETYLDLRIDKIGLKDASVYTNPTLVVSVFGE